LKSCQPEGKSFGLDASFNGAYGQDDRVCAYTAMSALTSLRKQIKLLFGLLFDKEEIGVMAIQEHSQGYTNISFMSFMPEACLRILYHHSWIFSSHCSRALFVR
jgi:aspartyl aminopeptidase